MRLEDPILRWILTDDRLRSLGADGCRAVVEALFALVLADGRRTDDELRRVRREMMRLPWQWDHKQELAEQALEAAQIRLTERAEELANGSMARDIATRIPTQPAREVVLKMLYAVAIADGISQPEEDRILVFRDAFGISEERAAQLREAAGTSNLRN